ncbi:MAG: hypothetical protein IH820_09245 [Bacteroidetes bacterium]|nr:hypothetical protein [Bacteroidota bacterium]
MLACPSKIKTASESLSNEFRFDALITRRAWAAKFRRQRHIGDFRDWTDPAKYKRAFEGLLRDLQAGV